VAGRSADLVNTRPPRLPVEFPVEDKGALDDLVKRKKIATAAQTVYIQGISKTCDPLIGRLLKISIPPELSDAGELGVYRIVKIKHAIDQNHRYRCEFEGIPASLKYFPTPELKIPPLSSVLGKVIWNNDPEGLGRVRVEFPFARDRQSYTWLRVMSPDAGGLLDTEREDKGKVAKNRGMVFVPEEGDQVMVGFEFGDPNRPYVMGSMFHGKNTEGGGENNNIKSIITRSGHTLEFDDSAGSLGITIKDENGNEIHLDSKGRNIEITAPETLSLNAKNIHLNAGENINLVSGKDTNQSVGENHILIVGGTSNVSVEKTLDILIMEDTSISVEKSLNQTAGSKLTQEAKSMEVAVGGTLQLASQDELTLKSGSDVIIAQ
jgi:uncharacterized protein involved in type VI secretion and phage assembly